MYSRRDLLRHIGASITFTAGAQMLSAQDVQHVHEAVATEVHNQPKALNPHEFATLQRLSELVVPGALEAKAADFIDFLCAATDDMKRIFTGGIAWLDEAMSHRYGKDFVSAPPAQQNEMLALIAYRENRAQDPSIGAGIQFFTWARNLVVDAYYTSPTGYKELGYMG